MKTSKTFFSVVSSVLFILALTTIAKAGSVTTDQFDYPPYSNVYIDGNGLNAVGVQETATAVFTDAQAPLEIICAADKTIECDAPLIFDPPTVTDNGDPNLKLIFVDSAAGAIKTRTWTATDAAGDSASCSQSITLYDTVPPVITCPEDYYANCGSGNCSTAPDVTGKATATDSCGGVVTITAKGGKLSRFTF